MDSSSHEQFLTCGELKIFPLLSQVEKRGRIISLEPKAMQLLLRLGRAEGQPVSKQDLLQDVWEHKAVVAQVLPKTIYQLRQALEDHPKQPQLIKTWPRLGYSLAIPMVAPLPRNAIAKGFKPSWGIAVFCLALLGITANHLRSQGAKAANLMVLPTQQFNDEDPSLLTSSLNMALKSQLIDYACIQVTNPMPEPRTTAYDGVLLESAVITEGNQAHLHLQLSHQESGKYFWAERIPMASLPNSEIVAADIISGIKKEVPIAGCPR